MANRYRKNPIEIEAVLYDGKNVDEIRAFAGLSVDIYNSALVNVPPMVVVHTFEGTLPLEVGEYLIKGIRGECYPCKPDIFEETYEPVTDHHVEVTGEVGTFESRDVTVEVESIGAQAAATDLGLDDYARVESYVGEHEYPERTGTDDHVDLGGEG